MADMLPEEIWKLRRDLIFELDSKIIPHICDWPKATRTIFFGKKGTDDDGNAEIVRVFVWQWLRFDENRCLVDD